MVQGLRLGLFLFFPPNLSNRTYVGLTNLNRPHNRDGGIFCLLTILVVVFLLKSSRSHQEFQEFLTEQIKLHYLEKGYVGTVLLYHRELTRVWFTDLTEIWDIVRFRYSYRRGAPARDPVDMFRSLFLMEMNHCNSVDDWVKELKTFPLWAILSGFSPDNVPGVGTFYDFMKRLWLADSPHLSKKVRKPKRKPDGFSTR